MQSNKCERWFRSSEYRAAQDALEAEIARLGIVGVPLDFRGKPLLTGIEAVP